MRFFSNCSSFSATGYFLEIISIFLINNFVIENTFFRENFTRYCLFTYHRLKLPLILDWRYTLLDASLYWNSYTWPHWVWKCIVQVSVPVLCARANACMMCDIHLNVWHINPRTAGGLSHLRTVGGGRMTAPPQRTRKLRKVATSGKRRWIGRGKFYKKILR